MTVSVAGRQLVERRLASELLSLFFFEAVVGDAGVIHIQQLVPGRRDAELSATEAPNSTSAKASTSAIESASGASAKTTASTGIRRRFRVNDEIAYGIDAGVEIPLRETLSPSLW